MTRSEAYAEGFQEGRRWAERDIREGFGSAFQDAVNREEVRLQREHSKRDDVRAEALGSARGYRDTVARYEAGTLTRQMFDHAPRGGTRA